MKPGVSMQFSAFLLSYTSSWTILFLKINPCKLLLCKCRALVLIRTVLLLECCAHLSHWASSQNGMISRFSACDLWNTTTVVLQSSKRPSGLMGVAFWAVTSIMHLFITVHIADFLLAITFQKRDSRTYMTRPNTLALPCLNYYVK